MKHEFDLLIFDMDGVLVDTTPCHRQAFEVLWGRLGVTGPSYERIAGRKTSEVVAEFTKGLRPAPEQLAEWARFKQALAREYLGSEEIIYGDSVDCLEALARRRYRLALATSASRETAGLALGRLGVGDLFSIIVTGEDVMRGKPAPEIYLNVIRRAAVIPQRTLIVEDSHAGLAAAAAAAACVASVRTGERVESANFIGAFPDLRGLLSWLEGARA